MFDIGLPELLVILVLALLVVGPQDLPSVALRAGRLYYQFRRQYEEITSEIRRELERVQREVDAATGLLSTDGNARTLPMLQVSVLGPAVGIEPQDAGLLLHTGLLGALRAYPLPQTAPQPPSFVAAGASPGEDTPAHGDHTTIEETLVIEARG